MINISTHESSIESSITSHPSSIQLSIVGNWIHLMIQHLIDGD